MSRVVALGEIMGRLSTPGYQRFTQAMPGHLTCLFAGAEANVVASLAYLGMDAALVTALPEHEIADACVAALRKLGVDTCHILRTASGRLGLYFLEQGANQRGGNVIYDREGSAIAITPASAYDWNAIFDQATWFHVSGITPAISRSAAEVAHVALEEASRRNLRISLDVNYRSKLWRWEPGTSPQTLASRTLAELLPYATVLIGGRADAAALLDIRPASDSASPELDVCRTLVARYPRLTHVAMSLREGLSAAKHRWGGMLYASDCDQAFFAPVGTGGYEPYTIDHVVDRLGTGDAFAAGLIHALESEPNRDPASAIAFATAAGCLAHSIEGDFNLVSRTEIEALCHDPAPGRLQR